MEMIEHNIELVVHGKAVEDSDDFCDYTIDNQNEAVVAKGVKPAVSSDFRPLVKSTVTFIVMGILINDEGQVLMMQEAKSSCAGQWYLPAGRMEAGEDIEEAVRREVFEETGLEFEPTTLLGVECAGGSWYRFILTGNVIGGILKTPANADSESLQALWVKDLSELSLRAKDILPFIERAKEYHSKSSNQPWHKPILPSVRPHSHLLMRLVVIIRKRSNNCVHVLVSEKSNAHIPVCAINPSRSIYSTLKKYTQEIFGSDLPPHKPHGLLSMEHSGKPSYEHDGMCLTILISVRAALEDVNLSDGYTWLELSTGVGNSILDRVAKNMTVPLNVIH
ncbi:hypothetical protein CHUAL_011447 [Chamberlinius hualienensis]